jgi:hypothetical protein
VTVDERKRHALYKRLEEVLDGEHADTVMELLPPVGWADVATKHDLDLKLEALEARMSERFTRELSTALRQQTWSIVVVLVMAVVINQLAGRLF